MVASDLNLQETLFRPPELFGQSAKAQEILLNLTATVSEAREVLNCCRLWPLSTRRQNGDTQRVVLERSVDTRPFHWQMASACRSTGIRSPWTLLTHIPHLLPDRETDQRASFVPG